jgi:heme-degrading monooxygenase HmoA
MIARLWRGWAASAVNADRYQDFLRTTFLPALHEIEGYQGVDVFRRTVASEIEFTTITRFDSLEAIRKFAGDDVEAAHVAPFARQLLARFDSRCLHCDIVVEDRKN